MQPQLKIHLFPLIWFLGVFLSSQLIQTDLLANNTKPLLPPFGARVRRSHKYLAC